VTGDLYIPDLILPGDKQGRNSSEALKNAEGHLCFLVWYIGVPVFLSAFDIVKMSAGWKPGADFPVWYTGTFPDCLEYVEKQPGRFAISSDFRQCEC